MGYEEFKVGIEYDGMHHWTDPRQHRRDIDRLAELVARGWLIIRVSADMLRHRPEVITSRTCQALRQAAPNGQLSQTIWEIARHEWPLGGR